jgi:hypothetical protein
MDEELLLRALHHWELHYANSPRFTLQRFVAEVAQEGGLQSLRSSMLLSLVKAMHMPEVELLPDPLADAGASHVRGSDAAAKAFALLMNNLIVCLPLAAQYQFCLDLMNSFANNPHLPNELINALENWLDRDLPLRVPPSSPELLRSLINRTYVLMCEHVGPVVADRLLALVVGDCQQAHPELGRAITELLQSG